MPFVFLARITELSSINLLVPCGRNWIFEQILISDINTSHNGRNSIDHKELPVINHIQPRCNLLLNIILKEQAVLWHPGGGKLLSLALPIHIAVTGCKSINKLTASGLKLLSQTAEITKLQIAVIPDGRNAVVHHDSYNNPSSTRIQQCLNHLVSRVIVEEKHDRQVNIPLRPVDLLQQDLQAVRSVDVGIHLIVLRRSWKESTQPPEVKLVYQVSQLLKKLDG
ncbi:hypothetical protein D3C86_705850 [compost metagenome]